jgi:hypothetical protein
LKPYWYIWQYASHSHILVYVLHTGKYGNMPHTPHILHTGIHGNMPLLPSYTTYWYIWQYASHSLIYFILVYTTICLTLAHILHTGIYDSMSHAHILRTLASIFCSLLFCLFSLYFYKGHK